MKACCPHADFPHPISSVVLRPAFGDQAGGGTDLARRAVAALEGVMLDEGLLQRMQRAALRQTLRWS